MPYLLETDVDPDPLRQFDRWYREAVAAGAAMWEAMTLATATREAKPSARTLLLKSYAEDGFVFYTNYQSRKSDELSSNPAACILFWWPHLERQIRIEGPTSRVSDRESDEYFATRPRGSQIGAWASDQSRVVPSREHLEERFRQLEARFAGAEVPRPPHWGGFRLRPERYEFWLNQPSRLHDRLQYRREADRWILERLAP